MRQATVEHVQALLAPAKAPCISLYMPTHRHHPERDGDPIRFRNLLRELAASLAQKHDKREVEARMAPFEALAHEVGACAVREREHQQEKIGPVLSEPLGAVFCISCLLEQVAALTETLPQLFEKTR